MDLWLIFLTGLTVGGLSCLAVQGGLLASTIASREGEDFREGSSRKHTIFPILAFLVSKLVAYTLLGFALGAFGAALSLSDSTRLFMQIVAGIYMIAVALNLLNVHPIFRYVIIQPPRFLYRLIRNQTKSTDLFAPALLGAMTIFIPCGTTLAMEALAISSGNPFGGAGIMAAFTLGTAPLFFGVGFITSLLGDKFRTRFLKLAAFAVLYLGIISVNSALVAIDSPLSLQSMAENSPIQIDLNPTETSALENSLLVKTENGVQVANIDVLANGYSPSRLQVKAGVPVRLNLSTKGGLGCTSAFRIPRLGISKNLAQNSTEVVEFTPLAPGKIAYTCSMGMYSGVIDVI